MIQEGTDRADLLNQHNINQSQGHPYHGGNPKSNKTRNIIIGGAVGGVAVLALVLGLTLGGGSNDGGGDIKPIIGGLNPYIVDESKTVN